METAAVAIKKLSDFSWEIPIGYRPGMRVPGLVFADERLMADIQNDKSLEQVANVATLPGIVKASMAMPDIHWGYGFPVGGVAATDPEAGGVISPGGVGFDINCLSGDAAVLHRLGYHRPIGDLVVREMKDEVRCYGLEDRRAQNGGIVAWLRKRPTASVLELVTSSGRRIVATSDHPFLTPSGMKRLGDLSPDELLAVDPFEGVPYEETSHDVLVDEGAIREFLNGRGKTAGNTIGQVIHVLRQRDLLPLRYDSPALPALIKTLGFVMGDGTLYFVGKTGKGVTWFFGKAEDLELIRLDLAPWFKISRIYSRRRNHRIQTDYGEVRFEATNDCCKATSSALAVLLAVLGCPVGNKSIQDYQLPAWLPKVPLWQKRLFLASYFGAELQAPRAFADRNRNFPCPLLTVQKQEHFAPSGRRLLEQISDMVKEFGAETLGIEERFETVKRKHGVSCRLRLAFSSKPGHLLALYARIGFEYNRMKRSEGSVVAAYQSLKREIWRQRQSLISDIVGLRSGSGMGAKRIVSELAMTGIGALSVNLRFVERTIYGGEDRTVRIPEGFPSFTEFRKEVTEGLGDSGLIWERIQRIEPRNDVEWVYDITVNHPDHNFVANGFVVHNCGVRLLRTNLEEGDVRPVLKTLVAQLFRDIPCGVGAGGDIRFTEKQERQILTEGARWIVKQGYGVPQDLEHAEARGKLEGADPDKVSERAYERGKGQVGTLGSGNHFLEVQVVDQVLDSRAAQLFGLREGSVAVMIHSGSRGLGYQVCDDYLETVLKACAKYGISLPDRQLACTPVNSPEGQAYLGAMRAAANYAWANRQLLMHRAREVFERVFGKSWAALGMSLVYDVAHNIAKMERYEIDGKERLLCVHRKGATRAFPPGHPELPEDYRPWGQPVIIPGDMGRNSYLLLGSARSLTDSFGSTCHGAGRVMSRTAAIRSAKGRSIRQELEAKGIIAMARGRTGLDEEQPAAYKDVNDVVRVVDEAGLSRRVCRMRPIGVIKG
ncbi:MAG: RtcB family protein [Candidatus Omnitrophica bacterium]|nr:RtcB family protein [Candidatus Omnitrophota bacterium]